MRVLQDRRPISHVADEGGVSRQRLTVWVQRFQLLGDEGLVDRSSRPARSPNTTPIELEDRIEAMRRVRKWGPDRIAGELALDGVEIGKATVWRILQRRGISRLRDIDHPSGESKRDVVRYEKDSPGDMIHIDVKKVGKIPDGGGWRIHGRGSKAALESKRKANTRPGYTYLHVAVDDRSRIAYVEAHNDERAVTALAHFDRALAFYASHGIDIVREVLTDNGSAYKSALWKAHMLSLDIRHRRTQRHRPQTNGKVERFNRTLLEEWAYARPYASEAERLAAYPDFLHRYNHHRGHTALGGLPPAARVTNLAGQNT